MATKTFNALDGDSVIVDTLEKEVTLDLRNESDEEFLSTLTPRTARKVAIALLKAADKVEAADA